VLRAAVVFLCAGAQLLLSSPALAREEPERFLGTPNGLARTPPMGWNSWNRFGCNVNEEIVRAAADAMVSSDMREAGYERGLKSAGASIT
jgi:alpha-galactosidase